MQCPPPVLPHHPPLIFYCMSWNIGHLIPSVLYAERPYHLSLGLGLKKFSNRQTSLRLQRRAPSHLVTAVESRRTVALQNPRRPMTTRSGRSFKPRMDSSSPHTSIPESDPAIPNHPPPTERTTDDDNSTHRTEDAAPPTTMTATGDDLRCHAHYDGRPRATRERYRRRAGRQTCYGTRETGTYTPRGTTPLQRRERALNHRDEQADGNAARPGLRSRRERGYEG